jgi:riboflavin biosynthesis pyrimidine reductase
LRALTFLDEEIKVCLRYAESRPTRHSAAGPAECRFARSGMSASSIECSTRRSRARGLWAPARATRGGGFDAAYAQARETAGDDGVDIAGGAWTVRQALIAGVVDELRLDIAPVLLGSGERIFDGVESLGMEPVEVLHSPLATHIRYRRAG